MMEQFSVIRKHLKKKLDPRRFEHTLGVEFTCAALAMRYGYDIKKAQLSGLLHDCAKRYPGPELLRRCLEREIPVTPAEEADPSLLHAKLGAWMAKEKYGVEDEEILEAIRCHTTGKPGMSLLDKLLYVADYIEPERDTAPELTQFRKMAFIDLDEACLAMMKANLEYLRESGRTIDPMTEVAYEDMKREVSERNRSANETMPERDAGENQKEGTTVGSVKKYGKARRRSTGREKGRRYQNYRH